MTSESKTYDSAPALAEGVKEWREFVVKSSVRPWSANVQILGRHRASQHSRSSRGTTKHVHQCCLRPCNSTVAARCTMPLSPDMPASSPISVGCCSLSTRGVQASALGAVAPRACQTCCDYPGCVIIWASSIDVTESRSQRASLLPVCRNRSSLSSSQSR